ncbi:hypothetical protein AAHA92_00895 [Salvia divinorum]|uniref:Uncharacterized protein n=1 Tax=Salvia divinorum TaxID=28513 RepID=A0ABD1ILM5_SALDI
MAIRMPHQNFPCLRQALKCRQKLLMTQILKKMSLQIKAHVYLLVMTTQQLKLVAKFFGQRRPTIALDSLLIRGDFKGSSHLQGKR